MAASHTRLQQTYDHRLRDLVPHMGDPDIVSEFGVPRSTALGWLRGEYPSVVTGEVLNMDRIRLQAEVLKLRCRAKTLGAIIGLLVALLWALDVRLEGTRLPEGATKPDELWHVDTTVVRLISGTKVYLYPVIDNFSRRILAWRVTEHFEVATTVATFHDAVQGALRRAESPTLVADSGVENVNSGVDGLIESGVLRRARIARVQLNRAASCAMCWQPAQTNQGRLVSA